MAGLGAKIINIWFVGRIHPVVSIFMADAYVAYVSEIGLGTRLSVCLGLKLRLIYFRIKQWILW